MHLTKLELHGFKTFADKTTIQFVEPGKDRYPITAIVGPNGSGKSNLADAIRWVLGEQSLKALRGKASEDVIFSGSEGRVRAGVAEVSLTLNNEDGAMPIEYAEVKITRRLYRDGQSEYLVNDSGTRLKDIKMLLAEANVGQRSYSVIGQGMVDHILVSSAEERKEFFDDATGVRPLQMKRHKSMLKLKRTHENLDEVEMILREIRPRLRSLERQTKRLEQREDVEQQLLTLEKQYYGTLWWRIVDKMDDVKSRLGDIDKNIAQETNVLNDLDAQVTKLEKNEKEKEKKETNTSALQKTYRDLQKKRNALRDKEFKMQKDIELKKARAQSNWAPLPLSKIIKTLQEIRTKHESLRANLSRMEPDALKKAVDAIFKRTDTLVNRLQKPSPDDIKPDEKSIKELASIREKKKNIEQQLNDVEQEMEDSAKKEKNVRTNVFDLQRKLRNKQKDIHKLETTRNHIEIEEARLEERQQNLKREMDEHMDEQAKVVRGTRIETVADTESVYPEIKKLRHKRELIGGIDPEIIQEHAETKKRYEFLDEQVADLQKAVRSTEKVIDELDKTIQKQSKKAFKQINNEFQKYFKVLFGGGSCSLVKMTYGDMREEEADGADAERAQHETDTAPGSEQTPIEERENRVVGIDIHATPPGKKMKNLNLLSGGERALTSIALLSAIMAVNPSPFVILDEVDAALDESNTVRFSAILEELQKQTQFVIITHNRATMERADVLYGVTMGDDGVSNLLSVKMTDVEEYATSRR